MIQKNDPIIRAIDRLFIEKLVPCYLAYSGGMDSHVLLHALASYQKIHRELQLTVLHINHQLHPDADQWALHCQTVCEQLDLPCKIEQVIINQDHGLEAGARHARYQAFLRHIKPASYLLTAHHQGDQAETFLLQALRGSGLEGLSGIGDSQPFGSGYLIRPFLGLSRAQLTHYAKQHQLNWIHDPSNDNGLIRRNFLRHHVFPLLNSYWPSAEKTLARSAALCADQRQLIARINKKIPERLRISQLLKQPSPERNQLLRQWCLKQQLGSPTQQQLNEINKTVLNANHAAVPQLTWQAPGNPYRSIIRRYRNQLYGELLKPTTLPNQPISFDYTHALRLETLGTITVSLTKGTGIAPSMIKNKKLYLTFRQGGERFFPVNRQGSHPLKKLFQEWGVPPWKRNQIPLITLDNEIIAVVGFCVAKGKAAKQDELGYLFTLIE